MHCGFRQSLLIGSTRVGLRHFQSVPTKDRHELVRCRTIVGRVRVYPLGRCKHRCTIPPGGRSLRQINEAK